VPIIAAISITGCDEQIGGYIPASAITRNGFFRDPVAAARASGRHIKLWGYVDHGNLYGDAGARRILREWWSGDGPNAGIWRFNLKAETDDPVGRSFAVLVPNDAGRLGLLKRFAADAGARRPTKVFVSGTLLTFEAPTQITARTGLYLELSSSQDVLLQPPQGAQDPRQR
jgi:hypothetical protein